MYHPSPTKHSPTISVAVNTHLCLYHDPSQQFTAAWHISLLHSTIQLRPHRPHLPPLIKRFSGAHGRTLCQHIGNPTGPSNTGLLFTQAAAIGRLLRQYVSTIAEAGKSPLNPTSVFAQAHEVRVKDWWLQPINPSVNFGCLWGVYRLYP